MSFGSDLDPSSQTRERNWMPVVIAATVVALVAAAVLLIQDHGRRQVQVTPISAAADAYAANLTLSGFAMSESSNLAGGKVTYLDGHIANHGSGTVTGITVQVLFRSYTKEVAQNETQSLKIIRMREPYIDVEPVSASPLKPGEEKDFRVIFDAVSPDWDGAYPEVRVLHVAMK